MNTIHWFRQDLRLADNPGLNAASEGSVLPIYILDEVNAKEHQMGQASKVWLNQSLQALNKALSGNLNCFVGDPLEIILKLCKVHNIKSVHWNRCYEPWHMERDQVIKTALQENGIDVHSHNGSLLWEPWEVKKTDGTHYKVFTPFYKKGCLNAAPPRSPLNVPKLKCISSDLACSIESMHLGEPNDPRLSTWQVGEDAAKEKLLKFIEHHIDHYKKGRDHPAEPFVSRLSPHIHFGEISPNQIWAAIQMIEPSKDTEHFCSELGWREFSYSQLYHFPKLDSTNLQSKFDRFPWKDDAQALKAWQAGQTGIPMVDAGMRQLAQEGYMHNRVRMIVGSFLVKNLLIDWRHGKDWFWEHLFDADLASNSASWQWVAGCGADAAPYFRIFNPVTQGMRFDQTGAYVKQYVPELKNLPENHIHAPWDAPQDILNEAGIELGKDYPKPLVDLKASRQLALDAYAKIKGDNA